MYIANFLELLSSETYRWDFALTAVHVCTYDLLIFLLQGSLSAYICIPPPRETLSLKMQL